MILSAMHLTKKSDKHYHFSALKYGFGFQLVLKMKTIRIILRR